MALVKDRNNIRLASLGMVDGNGHPYSWCAIINGYDKDAMADCPYPVIPQYLGAEPPENIGIDGARVTHLWCDDPAEAQHVAKASLIPNILNDPLGAIGCVDAVIIPTDKGGEHIRRAKPFIEAGLPIFIDKPLTDNEDDLRQFVRWQREGKAILSSSCMRYCREFAPIRKRMSEVGNPRFITMTTPKSWERYGIHALEGVYPFLEPGKWEWVQNSGDTAANIVHIRHASGVDIVIGAIDDMYGAFGYMNIYGTKGSIAEHSRDTFYAFKTQLVSFIDYLRTGRLPFAFEETVEMMKIIIAGIRSREENGRKVALSEIHAE